MPTEEMFDLMRGASRGDDVYGVRPPLARLGPPLLLRVAGGPSSR